MADDNTPQDAEQSKARYEVIVRAGAAERIDVRRVADMDLDRVPDPEGGVRLLVDMDEAARLVKSGFEVTIVQAAPTGPLDPSLVMDDDAARAWLDERLGDMEQGGQS